MAIDALADGIARQKLAAPNAGETVRFAQAADGKATLEIVLDAPAGTDVTLKADADIGTWLLGDARLVTQTVTIAATKPAAVDALPGNWSYALELPFKVEETMVNAVGDAGYIPLKLWETAEKVVVPLR